MKKLSNIYTKSVLGLVGALMILITSCEDYLDVSPKSQILTDEHFSVEDGYFDQLIGVYSKMAKTSMYGQQMSFGFTEVLAQNYDLSATHPEYRFAREYDYENSTTRNILDSIWNDTYNCIANLNIMLEYYEDVDPDIFTDNHYNLYRGEALGLRGFLHFEMMRGFAPSMASNSSAMGVPYVIEYEPKITSQVSVSETMDLVIQDLTEALSYLEVDTLYTSDERYNQDDRRYYFNYYAAKQVLARAYLWKGDLENAALVAEEIIADYDDFSNPAVTWTDYTDLQSQTTENKNWLFEDEMTFKINLVNMEDYVDPYFTSAGGTNAFTFSDDKVDEFFEKSSKGLGNDLRCLYGFQYDGAEQYLWKYHQYGRNNDMLPVIRKAEIYYIAAEALKETNPTRAIELLNIVRENKNIAEADALPDDLTSMEIQEEIFKEYRKMFLGEGQLFFYYKRLNSSSIEGAAVAANDAIYVWPMPENEIEFGDR